MKVVVTRALIIRSKFQSNPIINTGDIWVQSFSKIFNILNFSSTRRWIWMKFRSILLRCLSAIKNTKMFPENSYSSRNKFLRWKFQKFFTRERKLVATSGLVQYTPVMEGKNIKNSFPSKFSNWPPGSREGPDKEYYTFLRSSQPPLQLPLRPKFFPKS